MITKTSAPSQFEPFQKQPALPFLEMGTQVRGLRPFTHNYIAVTGISTGDEGKGRTIPDISAILRAQTGLPGVVGMVFKVNGGANSGHTVDGLKLNLLPGAVADPLVPILGIGRGVVADPLKFHWEGSALERKGYEVFSRLLIDRRTMISDITDRLLDLAQEASREVPIGTTGKGIGPAFSKEVLREAVYYGDIEGDNAAFISKLRNRIKNSQQQVLSFSNLTQENWKQFFVTLTEAEVRANKESIDAGLFTRDDFDLTRFCGVDPLTFNEDEIINAYFKATNRLKPNVGSIANEILNCKNFNKKVVGEFGQSYILDKRHGFQPNTSASHTYTPEFFQSGHTPVVGIHVVGVAKAYDTKVGNHLFLTEMEQEHPLGNHLRKFEFGVTTGRQRMVGWFDAVEKGFVLRYGGFDDMVINKIDVLTREPNLQPGWDGNLQICYAYRNSQDQIIRNMPEQDSIRESCTPVYLSCPSWNEDISSVRSFKRLPYEAQRYVANMFAATVLCAYGTENWASANLPQLRIIGVGPNSSQVILDAPDAMKLMQLADPTLYSSKS